MRMNVIGAMIAVVVLFTVAEAQTNQVQERFKFKVANASQVTSSSEGWLELVVNQWSSEAERDRVLSALRENGPDKLPIAIAQGYAVGYLHWPGNLEYTLRYAYRVPRPDGGEDVIVGVDQPISFWWNSASPASSPSQPVVIQLRVNKDGRGEGKVATKVAANASSKTIMLEDFATPPSVLIDVQREQSVNAASNAS